MRRGICEGMPRDAKDHGGTQRTVERRGRIQMDAAERGGFESKRGFQVYIIVRYIVPILKCLLKCLLKSVFKIVFNTEKRIFVFSRLFQRVVIRLGLVITELLYNLKRAKLFFEFCPFSRPRRIIYF